MFVLVSPIFSLIVFLPTNRFVPCTILENVVGDHVHVLLVVPHPRWTLADVWEWPPLRFIEVIRNFSPPLAFDRFVQKRRSTLWPTLDLEPNEENTLSDGRFLKQSDEPDNHRATFSVSFPISPRVSLRSPLNFDWAEKEIEFVVFPSIFFEENSPRVSVQPIRFDLFSSPRSRG